jgi:ankyrin repeat protein
LVDSSADTQGKDSYLRNPLYYAARGGHTGIFDYLLHLGLNLFALDAKGDGVLCYASPSSHLKVLEAAFNKGLTIDSENTHWSPLYWVCRAGRPEAVELLTKEGLRSEIVSVVQLESEWSPLAISVFYSN